MEATAPHQTSHCTRPQLAPAMHCQAWAVKHGQSSMGSQASKADHSTAKKTLLHTHPRTPPHHPSISQLLVLPNPTHRPPQRPTAPVLHTYRDSVHPSPRRRTFQSRRTDGATLSLGEWAWATPVAKRAGFVFRSACVTRVWRSTIYTCARARDRGLVGWRWEWGRGGGGP